QAIPARLPAGPSALPGRTPRDRATPPARPARHLPGPALESRGRAGAGWRRTPGPASAGGRRGPACRAGSCGVPGEQRVERVHQRRFRPVRVDAFAAVRREPTAEDVAHTAKVARVVVAAADPEPQP